MNEQTQKPTVDWNRPIQSRNGQPAKFVGRVNHPYRPVVVAVEYSGQREAVYQCSDSGEIEGGHYSFGIINVPEPEKRVKMTMWVNIELAPVPPHGCYANTYSTRGHADAFATPNRLACVEVQIDVPEGHGL